MTDKIGVLIMEESDGRFGIQLFADPEKARANFEQMHGRQGQPPARATFLILDWQNVKFEVQARNLPMPVEDPEKRPDAWRIGEGPISFPKKSDKDNSGG